ncbi:MAG: TonB family protein [Pseudomonadota bacterium]
MSVRADFGLFLTVAVVLHLIVLTLANLNPQDSAGASGGGAQAAAASENLAALIESWDAQPETEVPADQETIDPVEDTADAPEPMQSPEATETADQPTQEAPRPSELPDVDTPKIPTPQVPDTQIARAVPTEAPPLQVQQQEDATPVKIPALPIVPESPNSIQVDTRADEPEPDPNQAFQAPRSLTQAPPEPLETDAPRLETDTRPEIAALTPPEAAELPDQEPFQVPEEIVPEDTGPAPVIARLPTAKPELPDWMVAEQREAAKQAEARRQQRQQKKREKQRQQQQQQQRQQAKKEKKPQRQQTQQAQPAKPDKPAEQPSQAAEGAAKPSSGGSTGSQQQAALGAGTGTARQGTGYSAAAISSAKSRYISAVRRAIAKKKRYPKRARRRGITGRASIRLTLSADGQLLGVSLAKSSGSDLLDEAALKAARAVGRYPKIPKEMGRSKVSFTQPIGFVVK